MSTDPSPLQLQPELGSRLRHERERLEMTQEQLAERLNIARRSVINYETEANPVPLEYIKDLSQLGADLHFMLFGLCYSDIARAPNPAVIEVALEWAAILCKDRKGKPFTPKHTAKFIAAAYAYLAGRQQAAEDLEEAQGELAKIARRVA